MSHEVAVIGAGAWGTAVAELIARKKKSVCLWAYEPEVVADINEYHENSEYLPGVNLSETLTSTNDLEKAVNSAEFIILATPSLFLERITNSLAQLPAIQNENPIIGILTKGFIKRDSGPCLITTALEDILPPKYKNNLVYVSGPSHAEEVVRGKLTGLISASANAKNSIRYRELLMSQSLMVFSSFDVIGVQTCAAVKNVIAIAFGLLDAMMESYNIVGDNTESLLLAAGLNEIQTLGKALGSTHPETFTSIAGVGDLDVTCRSKYGRNRRFGREIMLKKVLRPFKNIDDLIDNITDIGYIPEGVVAARFVHSIIKEQGLKMPIAENVYKLLNREEKVRDIMNNLVRSMTTTTSLD